MRASPAASADKAALKLFKQLHRVLDGVQEYVTTSRTGLRVISSVCNVAGRVRLFQEASVSRAHEESILGPLVIFSDITPRLLSKHLEELDKQCRNVRVVNG